MVCCFAAFSNALAAAGVAVSADGLARRAPSLVGVAVGLAVALGRVSAASSAFELVVEPFPVGAEQRSSPGFRRLS